MDGRAGKRLRRTEVCDEILPVGEFTTKSIVKTFELKTAAETFRDSWNEMVSEECPGFGFSAISNSDYL